MFYGPMSDNKALLHNKRYNSQCFAGCSSVTVHAVIYECLFTSRACHNTWNRYDSRHIDIRFSILDNG